MSVVSAGLPGAPTSLNAATASGKGVQLTWLAPSNTGGGALTSYKVYRASSSSGPWSVVASVSGTTPAYKDTSTTRGVTYYYEVTAVNSAGEGLPSNIAGPVMAK